MATNIQSIQNFVFSPLVPTLAPGTSTLQAASTAFVGAAIVAAATGVSSFNTRTGAVTLTLSDVTTALAFTPYNSTNPSNYIPLTALSASGPLSYVNTTGVFSIAVATTTVSGYLAFADWNTFNNKQAALSGSGIVKSTAGVITYITGASTNFVKADGTLDSSVYLTANQPITITASGDVTGVSSASGTSPAITLLVGNAAVIAKVLTGLSISGSGVLATDSIVVAFGKLQNQVNGLVGSMIYQGVWNASTNTPTLTSGSGTKGYVYKVSVAGSTTLDGVSQWNVNDQVVFDGTTWDKIDGIASEVISFNTRVGAIILSSSDVTTALGFTPYNATNPASYITAAALVPYAPLASPTFTGVPLVPTATVGTNTTQIASTAFVLANQSVYTAGTNVTIASNVVSVANTAFTRKYAVGIGNGSLTSIVITHNLNLVATNGVFTCVVQVFDTSGNYIVCDVQSTSTNTVTLGFGAAPAINAYTAVVQG